MVRLVETKLSYLIVLFKPFLTVPILKPSDSDYTKVNKEEISNTGLQGRSIKMTCFFWQLHII